MQTVVLIKRVLGWVVLANDIAQITVKVTARYNNIARGEDKLW
nr:hypothetical protein [Serratia rubidaea]